MRSGGETYACGIRGEEEKRKALTEDGSIANAVVGGLCGEEEKRKALTEEAMTETTSQENIRPAPDQELVDIADYVLDYRIEAKRPGRPPVTA